MFNVSKCKTVVDRFNKELGLEMVITGAVLPKTNEGSVLIEEHKSGRVFSVDEASAEEKKSNEDFAITEIHYGESNEVDNTVDFGYCNDFSDAIRIITSAILCDNATNVWAKLELEAMGVDPNKPIEVITP